MAENLNTRVSRLEELMGRAFTAIEALAEKQGKLDDVLVTLTDAQIETEQRFRETDARFHEIAAHSRETDARFRETDARIDKLVSAIGELIRVRNGGTQG